jgi:hypothetical protein
MEHEEIMTEVQRMYLQMQDSKRSLARAEQPFDIAKKDFVSILFDLGQEADDDVRKKFLNYVYWNCREIKVTDIENSFQIRRGTLFSAGLIEPLIIENVCSTCGKLLEFKFYSRTQLGDDRKGGDTKDTECSDCCYNRNQEANRLIENRIESHNQRLIELRQMPYEDYLKSPEWQVKRQQSLRRAGFRCYLCNIANTTLDVYHRTYERRGDEYNSDLIVLCRDCHSKHHEKIEKSNEQNIQA